MLEAGIQEMQIKNILVLVGTVWPVAGFCLAVFIGLLLTGWKRWVMLFAGPVVFLLPCYLYASEIAYNGNMLFVVLFGFVFVFGYLYYPFLVIAGIVSFLKGRNKGRGQD